MSNGSFIYKINSLRQSSLVKNSFWGIASNVLQNVFVSVFFIIITRKYAPSELAGFLVANTLYQMVAAFSAMGLGQWFIREYMNDENKKELTGRFLKFQVVFGAAFYFINILMALVLYDEPIIYTLSIVFGLNVLFDNIIYGIKHLNIAEFKQQKTFIILIVDAFLRMLAAALLFIQPISVVFLCSILVVIRFVTLNLFLQVGSSNSITAFSLFSYKISWADTRKLILHNWRFVVIGSVSVVFWRIASLVVSKLLGDVSLANYEISFKIFSLAQVIPLITSASVYPILVKKYQTNGVAGLRLVYRWFFIIYAIFGLACYTFVYSFADWFIPFLFGDQYPNNPVFTRQMFLTMLVFPTALLQANIIVAMKHEKADMIYNVIAMIVNVVGSIVGAYYLKDLSCVNYSIFAAFVVFHLLQDIFLIKQKISSLVEVAGIYILYSLLLVIYSWLTVKLNAVLLFTVFWLFLVTTILFYIKRKKMPVFFTR